MKALAASQLMKKYAVCPECGSDKIGPDKGGVAIKNKSFHRSCACGWSVEIKEEDVTNEI